MGRIIFVNRYFWPDYSATAQILSAVAFDLASAGHDVRVIADSSCYHGSGRLPLREEHGGVGIMRVRVPVFGRKRLWLRVLEQLCFMFAATLRLLCIARGGDVVIVKTDPPLLLVPIGIAAWLRGARLVNWLQDLYPETASALGIGAARGFTGAILLSLRNFYLRHALVNIAIGAGMAGYLRRTGVKPSLIRVSANFADNERIRPLEHDRNQLRREWGFAPDDVVIAYAGNLGLAHDIDTMLAAIERLRDCSGVKFLFVGGGPDKLVDAALPGLEIRPYQPPERLGEVLAVGDVHWLSLRPELEGFIVPSKLYGIAAAGRGAIMIGSSVGEVGQILARHGWGEVIEPGEDAALAALIVELAGDERRRCELGVAARRFSDEAASRDRALRRWRDMAASWR